MNILLGVSGSIAAYRAADLARDFMRLGHTVRVCLTDSAQQFVTPALFEALTGQPCLIDTFEEPEIGRMAHINWARQADLIVIAPATANTLNKIANGVGEDMLTTLVLASDRPLIVAPAMNPQMYVNAATQHSLELLAAWASVIVEPIEGDVACGEHGQGKLASNAEIVAAAQTVLARRSILMGRKVLITSGPTQEAIDDVRFISNRSSGKMGASLARAALLMGAQVTVVTGPVRVPYPIRSKVVRVKSALEMLEAAIAESQDSDFIIGAAAVADYRPAIRVSGKIRRSKDPLSLDLVPNPDIIAELSRLNPKSTVIGFAAEPDTELETAKEKLVRKSLAAIAVNDVSQSGIGFDSEENELTLITADGESHSSGHLSKLGCGLWLLEHAASLNKV